MSDGTPPTKDNNTKVHQHPIKNKWDRHSRYFWLNLQNMIFSKRGTAEFRLHTATLNAQKMINWLFICNAIVKYAEVHQLEMFKSLAPISLVEVLYYYRDTFPNSERAAFLSDYLIAYYKERCSIFKRDMEKEDKVSDHELRNDKHYTFVYQGMSMLF